MNRSAGRHFFVTLFALLFLVNSGFAAVLAGQPTNASITVIRMQDQQPLADVTVIILPLNEAPTVAKAITTFTDRNGVVNYTFTQPVIIQLSYLGLGTITDTIRRIENKIYQLQAIQNIQDVVVTGQYTAGSAQKSLYEIKVITQEELKARGANNLREALQSKLNVDLGQDGVYGSSVSINGISGEGVKIMVDGVPIVGRLDGKLDLSQINLNNIDHIEIVEGPLSVIYGTDAMGGVINIITKTFQADKVNINLKGYYETAGVYNVELNTGFTFKKHQIYLSGGRYFFDGYTTLDSIERYREWKAKEQYFADAKYVINGPKSRFSLSGSFFREMLLDRGEPRLTLTDINTSSWTYTGTDGHILTYRPRATASFMHRFKIGSELNVLLGYSGWFRFSNKYAKDLVTGKEQLTSATDQDTSRYHQIVTRSTYTLSTMQNRLSFMFGIDINQEFVNQNRIAGNNKKLGDYAAFGSAKITVVEGFDIQPAIRFAYNTLYKTPLIPSLNLRYNWKDKLVARASYARGYRSPSVKELFLDFVIEAHIIKGNEDLKAEDGHNAMASLNYNFVFDKHKLSISGSGFYNLIKKKIDLVLVGTNTSGTAIYQYFNFNQQSTYGAALGASYKWNRLNASAQMQYTGYKVIYKSASEGVNMWSPDFSFSAGYLIPKAEIGVNINYKYNGIKPLYLAGIQFHAGKREAYHLLDVSLTRNFWKDRIQLTVGGKNLAGVKNVDINGEVVVGHSANPGKVNIAWGQTFFTSLILHFSK